MNKNLFFILSLIVLFAACRGEAVPKPRGYFRVTLPEHSYSPFASECDIAMDVPNYAKIEIFKDKISEDSCWFNIQIPRFKATIYCTYFKVNGNLESLIGDSYAFAAKHEMKATALKRTLIHDQENKLNGIIYDIEGEAASQAQFFLTDSTTHFFRGSLYFNNKPNPDSIAPVLEFVRKDIDHMVRSVRWEY